MSYVEVPVSGILPIRNGSFWIDQTIPGVLACLRKDDELLILNDGSTDDTESRLISLTHHDPRVRLINSRGEGLVKTLNLGISEASHTWLARFDVDDVYFPSRLSRQVGVISKVGADCGAIFSDYRIRSSRGRNLGVIYSPVFHIQTKLSLYNSQRTAHPSVLLNRDAVNSVGGYLDDEFPAEDLGLWVRLSRIGKLASFPGVLMEYVKSDKSVSSVKRMEVISKTKTVLQNFKFSAQEIHELEAIIESPINGYSKVSEGKVRSLLFLYDLVSSHKKLGMTSEEMRSHAMKLCYSAIESWDLESFKISVDRLRRKLDRII